MVKLSKILAILKRITVLIKIIKEVVKMRVKITVIVLVNKKVRIMSLQLKLMI